MQIGSYSGGGGRFGGLGRGGADLGTLLPPPFLEQREEDGGEGWMVH